MINEYTDRGIPDIVRQRKEAAFNEGFEQSCKDEAGRLLSVMAAQAGQGRILEIGTGLGVGSAWILSGLSPEAELVSIDNSFERIEKVRGGIHHKQAIFLHGDWKEAAVHGPFKLIFADAASAKQKEGEDLIKMLDQNGVLFMDDFTPEEHFPEEWKGKPDTVREFGFHHALMASAEILLTSKCAAIIAVKKG
ncbi:MULTISPECIES: O-methyltransferase [Bacillaceae]|nr:class I SAM-dependent methyltransferase [Bacillus infantis]MCP1158868.1 methyltransferase domain-containing protein [Bacillus infantis]MDW2877845.1 methyltransferase domain-containing protein [Bacillus infantis]